MAAKGRHYVSQVRGVGRLAVDATRGVTDLVEAMHETIVRGPRMFGAPGAGLTLGLTSLVYQSIRRITGAVGATIDVVLREIASLVPEMPTPAAAEAAIAALNGVLGDHLAATGNPLAIEMQLRREGRPIALDREALRKAFPQITGKVLLLVHGSSMSDLQWDRLGHDHGAALERDLGYCSLYLRYNSGLHISTNGRAFAGLLETLAANWPVPIEQLAIVSHSMGGLVSRSACHAAAAAGHAWPALLRKMVFLGTPHHGTHLEQRGNWVDLAFRITPYTAPFARLGKIRSAGVTDLRYGSLLDEDWENRDRFELQSDSRRPVPLPTGVECFAIGAIRAKDAGSANPSAGDGLVPLASALGRHSKPEMTLGFPRSRQWVGSGMNHLDLLSHREVYEVLSRWLRIRKPIE
jgi:pimeloyl-ACP methyl ester carboxylesterase